MNDPTNIPETLAALQRLQETTNHLPLLTRLTTLGQTTDGFILGQLDEHDLLTVVRSATKVYETDMETFQTTMNLLGAVIKGTNHTEATITQINHTMEWLQSEHHLLGQAGEQIAYALKLVYTFTRFDD